MGVVSNSTQSSAEFVPEDYFRVLRAGELFPDTGRPLEIDLGCGEGSFLIAMAKAFPERDFLGVERMASRITKVARRIAWAGVTNAKLLRLESSYTVGWLLPTASVSRLHLLCPDPWPKKKHAERRLFLSEEFTTGLARVLVPGGEFLLKTDDAHYFEEAVAHLNTLPAFTRIDWPDDAFVYPQTDFERQWLRAGRVMNRARWITTA
jgi:tRNA (guanine-N7-)-methyltransferase